MKKLFTYGAVASIFLLTAGSAAFAQNYNPNYGPGGMQGQSGVQGQSGMQGQGWNQGGFGSGQSGMQGQGWNQGGFSAGQSGNQGWNRGGMQGQGSGSMQQSGTQGQEENEPTAQDAWQELNKYGYKNIGGMERAEGWQARATRNGEQVFVFIDDDGMIATYRGNGQ